MLRYGPELSRAKIELINSTLMIAAAWYSFSTYPGGEAFALTTLAFIMSRIPLEAFIYSFNKSRAVYVDPNNLRSLVDNSRKVFGTCNDELVRSGNTPVLGIDGKCTYYSEESATDPKNGEPIVRGRHCGMDIDGGICVKTGRRCRRISMGHSSRS